MKTPEVKSAQSFALLCVIALGLAACSSDSPSATVVEFKNGISAGFQDGLCVVRNTKTKDDVAPTVLVVLNPANAPEVEGYTIVPGDAYVMRPADPPTVPEFPVFIVSGENKIVHVVGDRGAVPKNIAQESIALAAAGRRTCAIAAEAVGKTAKATAGQTQ